MATAVCPLYLSLEARVVALKEKFVREQLELEAAEPMTFIADLDRLAAFRLLAHAEFEEYLESKAREGLDRLEKEFKSGNGSIRGNIAILVIGAMLGRLAKFDAGHWGEFVHAVLEAARLVISDNNGIKGGAFLQLAVFSGKMPDEVDVGLAAALTSYGKSRGDVAHKSVTRVRTILAPSAEAKAAEDLLSELRQYFTPASAP